MKKRMKKVKMEECCNGKKGPYGSYESCGGAFYFLGAIGAAIYYIGAASTFWTGVLGLLKALVWPVFLVFELLKFLVA